MSTLQQHQKESPVQEANPSKAPLLTPIIRNEIGPSIDGNIEFDLFKDPFQSTLETRSMLYVMAQA